MPSGARAAAEVARNPRTRKINCPQVAAPGIVRRSAGVPTEIEEKETLPEMAAAWLATTRDFPVRATISRAPLGEDARARQAVAILGKLARGEDLEIGGSLGEGGMSVVRTAHQVALGREVAVKTMREEIPSDDDAILHMLREAWITGALEHPNVVPVHDISLDVQGKPRIVLKRIVGSPWRDVMQEQSLEWNVRTLMQVCNAVHFAHSRGIIHRDLKSENVMIGEFGEVYVVDWGLAVALHDDGTGRFPLASEIDSIGGTPAYMAPEMLQAKGSLLGVHTDVYLLGGILYEVLTGWPPHMGTTIAIVMQKVARSAPPIPNDVPFGLRAILQRALARDPADRFASADELRQALGEFLEHRTSTSLAMDAGRKLAELEKTIAGASSDERRLRAYHLFGECRFGFREALRAWPENDVARNGLRRAVVFMVELELAEGDPRAAQLLVSELDDPPAYLADRVAAAARARREKEQRLASMVRDLDPRVGRRLRLTISAALGVLWTILPWIGFVIEWNDPHADQKGPLVSSTLMLVVAALVARRYREALSRTAINRALVRAVGVVLTAQIVLFAATLRLGVAYEATRVLVLVLYAACSALTAATVERRLWPTPIAYAVVALIATIWPLAAWPVESIANLALTINVLVVWRRDDETLARGVVRGGG